MRELKVQCDCGQKFKFDVEPVNNQMPFRVNCPLCGKDGTDKANAILAQETYPAAPAPSAMVPPPPPVPAGQPALRISAAAPAAVASPAEAPTTPPPSATSTRAQANARYANIATSAVLPDQKKGNFGMGLLGGAVGALIGTAIYYAIFRYTGFQFKLLAIGVGALAGWGAELLGKGEGSKELGSITAVLVLVGLIGAQYFVALGWWHQDLNPHADKSAYAQEVAEAKKVVAAVPTGSDQEIRAYLVKVSAEEGEKVTGAEISADDIKQFREQLLPEYRDLASGKLTKEQYEAKNQIDPEDAKKGSESDEGTFQAVFLLLLLSKVNLVSLVGAAAAAYKLSTNA